MSSPFVTPSIMEQAQNEAVWGVLDGLFTDLDEAVTS